MTATHLFFLPQVFAFPACRTQNACGAIGLSAIAMGLASIEALRLLDNSNCLEFAMLAKQKIDIVVVTLIRTFQRL